MPARFTRRTVLAAGAGAVVAACSRSSTRRPEGRIVVANFPLYIDAATNRDFTRATGIDVEYHESAHPEEIDGADVVIEAGSGAPLWATTMVGVATAKEVKVTRLAQLFQPELAGRVALPADMRQALGIALLADHVDPATVTLDQATATAGRLANSVRIGQVVFDERRDVQVMRASDTIGTDLTFVVPDEGGLLFTDVVRIASKATNPTGAQQYLDFVADPAHLAERLRVVPSVLPLPDERLEQLLRRDAPAVLDDPRRNPSAEVRARLRPFRDLSEDEQAQFDALFGQVVRAAQ